MDFQEELIPGLPQDVALQCLIRVGYENHSEMLQVCKDWRGLISSSGFYSTRERSDQTSPSLCLVQAVPKPPGASQGAKQSTLPIFSLSLYDFCSKSWQRLPAIPDLDAIPLFCQIAGVDGKIFVIGGWNPSTFEAMRSIYCFDFSTRSWSRCPDMSIARSFFACGAVNGKIFVAGGHDENKNALRSSEAFDVAENRWEPLPDLSQERDECRGIISRGKFSVLGGYRTDSQGEFSSSSEILSESFDSWAPGEKLGEGFITGSVSGEVYCFRENGELWKMNGKKVGVVPVPGKIVAACAGSGRLNHEIVVIVQDQSGVCRGVGFNPGSKNCWEVLGDGGEEFSGIVQAACFVDI